jgi:hypothetical protein
VTPWIILALVGSVVSTIFIATLSGRIATRDRGLVADAQSHVTTKATPQSWD